MLFIFYLTYLSCLRLMFLMSLLHLNTGSCFTDFTAPEISFTFGVSIAFGAADFATGIGYVKVLSFV